MKNWEQLAMGQAEVIFNLSHLCSDLITELAQYHEVADEEQRLNELEGGQANGTCGHGNHQ